MNASNGEQRRLALQPLGQQLAGGGPRGNQKEKEAHRQAQTAPSPIVAPSAAQTEEPPPQPQALQETGILPRIHDQYQRGQHPSLPLGLVFALHRQHAHRKRGESAFRAVHYDGRADEDGQGEGGRKIGKTVGAADEADQDFCLGGGDRHGVICVILLK